MAHPVPPPRRSTACEEGVCLWTVLGLAVLAGVVGCATARAAERPGDPVMADPDDVSIDRDLPMFLHIEDRQPVLSARENLDEATAYNYLLTRAHDASAAAFARKSHPEVRHYHLWDDPQKYRGEIVHVEGELRMLRRYDAPKLAQNGGVRDLYEGWVRDDHDKHNLWCIIFTDLPEGLNVDGSRGQHVAFDGYFFKLYRYTDNNHDARLAPLLIGHAPEYEVPVAHTFPTTFLLCFLGLISTTVTVVLAVAWWFRRGDDRVRQRLRVARAAQLMETFPAGGETVPPTPEG
jgi:hypothetical protein